MKETVCLVIDMPLLKKLDEGFKKLGKEKEIREFFKNAERNYFAQMEPETEDEEGDYIVSYLWKDYFEDYRKSPIMDVRLLIRELPIGKTNFALAILGGSDGTLSTIENGGCLTNFFSTETHTRIVSKVGNIVLE